MATDDFQLSDFIGPETDSGDETASSYASEDCRPAKRLRIASRNTSNVDQHIESDVALRCPTSFICYY